MDRRPAAAARRARRGSCLAGPSSVVDAGAAGCGPDRPRRARVPDRSRDPGPPRPASDSTSDDKPSPTPPRPATTRWVVSQGGRGAGCGSSATSPMGARDQAELATRRTTWRLTRGGGDAGGYDTTPTCPTPKDSSADHPARAAAMLAVVLMAWCGAKGLFNAKREGGWRVAHAVLAPSSAADTTPGTIRWHGAPSAREPSQRAQSHNGGGRKSGTRPSVSREAGTHHRLTPQSGVRSRPAGFHDGHRAAI